MLHRITERSIPIDATLPVSRPLSLHRKRRTQDQNFNRKYVDTSPAASTLQPSPLLSFRQEKRNSKVSSSQGYNCSFLSFLSAYRQRTEQMNKPSTPISMLEYKKGQTKSTQFNTQLLLAQLSSDMTIYISSFPSTLVFLHKKFICEIVGEWDRRTSVSAKAYLPSIPFQCPQPRDKQRTDGLRDFQPTGCHNARTINP